RKSIREHQRFGAALRRRGEQLKGAATVGLGAAATAMRVGHDGGGGGGSGGLAGGFKIPRSQPKRDSCLELACFACLNAATRGAISAADPRLRSPITGIPGCCARAASGHATATPPSSEMNVRRCSGRDVRFIARPPHRTVRAAFPHTAPTLGV